MRERIVGKCQEQDRPTGVVRSAGVWGLGKLIRKSWPRKSEWDCENNKQKSMSGQWDKMSIHPRLANRDAVILKHAERRKRVG